jgi:hypothetical protein
MLNFNLWGRDWLPATIAESLGRFRKNPVLLAELRDLISLKLDLVADLAPSISLPFFCPLELSAEYIRNEILAALGIWRLDRQREVREGVLWVPEIQPVIRSAKKPKWFGVAVLFSWTGRSPESPR